MSEQNNESRPSELSNITIVSLDLGRYVGSELPNSVVEVVRRAIDKQPPEKRLRGTWVQGFGVRSGATSRSTEPALLEFPFHGKRR